MSTTTTVHVAGMSCGHCVQAVSGELKKIDGVTDVQVDLASGRVDVTSDADLTADAIAAAVDVAGYEVSP
jgi:copper ion binding protein